MNESDNRSFDKPDGFKWVITIPGEIDTGGAVFTDMKHAGEFIGISESTFRRRVIEHGDSFKLNGYTISKLPYFKSKRGNYD